LSGARIIIYLLEAGGSPYDLVARQGRAAPTYRAQATPAGLAAGVRVGDDGCRAGRPAELVGSEDHALVDADAVHPADEAVKPRRRRLRAIGRRGAPLTRDEVVRASADKRMILAPDKLGRATGPASVVADAHARGLRVFTWTPPASPARDRSARRAPDARRGRTGFRRPRAGRCRCTASASTSA
jgi:glycerophosphoryl diester phosphodiesterase